MKVTKSTEDKFLRSQKNVLKPSPYKGNIRTIKE